MTSVGQFAQYLLKQDPQRNQARLALYNFMKHVLEPELPFAPMVIQAFYARVLQFDHWQSNAQMLGEVVRQDVEGFLKIHALEGEIEPWLDLRHADQLQVVPIRNFQDIEELALLEHSPRQKSGDQVRCLKLSEQQILVLIMSATGSLEAKVYPHKALVWGAHLRLMSPVSHLYYGPDFELMPHVRQVLEGSLLTTHCFHVDSEGTHGLITRGHTFQKFETFIRAKLADTQDLFSSLKRVERHFINPQSDSYYQEMVTRLERANRLLTLQSPDVLDEADRALNRGRVCLKNVFPNDRLLTLLITHLEYGLAQRRSPSATQ